MGKIILVAECGINHNGDLELAKRLIKKSKDVGMDYVKFQKRTIDLVYSKEELESYRESPWGTTFRQQKEGLEFNKEQYDEINRYCKEIGIPWFASPWDLESINFLTQYNPPYIKVPSALVTYRKYLEAIAETKIPVIMSTGMSNKNQIDTAMDILGENLEILLHTTATYPCKFSDLNLLKIRTLIKEYGHYYTIGYSNHSPSAIPILFAMALGAEVIETHITHDRSAYGSDQSSALEKRQLETICEWRNELKETLGNGKWKIFDSEIPVMKKLRKHYDF
ncbi:MAG TPA: N-acetylneuraminate synthase family protein [Bacteroidales bacterium]|mgnify:CR=1 FL=1|nr:N-acetylneuraminate synthase family protein [Bacteroidales bacterium]